MQDLPWLDHPSGVAAEPLAHVRSARRSERVPVSVLLRIPGSVFDSRGTLGQGLLEFFS